MDYALFSIEDALSVIISNEHPERWSKSERNWQPIGAVELNPEQYKEAA
ncbi:hypothetical protein [Colwellia sp. TT2012]|nr:hypothetical protein [Colwellia sp. TT2012]